MFKTIILLIFTFFVISCKNSDNKTYNLSSSINKDSLVSASKLETNINDINNETVEKLKNFQGVWFGYKFIKDKNSI